MKTVFRILGVVVGVVVFVALSAWIAGGRALAVGADVPLHTLKYVPDAGSIERGQRLATLYVCTECHGPSLAGTNFMDAMPMARLPAPNLTGQAFTDDELHMAVRHGLGADGRPLMIMPSAAYSHLSDADMGDMIAYIQSIPSVPSDLVERRIGPIGRLVALIAPDDILADRKAPRDTVHPATTPELDGAYLTALCSYCHGEGLGGAEFPVENVVLWAPNLTRHETGLGAWALEDFDRLLREGVRPDGSTVDQEMMPARAYSAFHADEVSAIWDYLRALPPADNPPPTQ